ncbi:hypothetical protein [Benzoatithermus flavus]|uniref:Uncharacterized protein n=1 Tax=Benzoatithermus flavus TaxID=3108223 RepID=A0ABU8XTN3_9PROT
MAETGETRAAVLKRLRARIDRLEGLLAGSFSLPSPSTYKEERGGKDKKDTPSRPQTCESRGILAGLLLGILADLLL